MEYSEQLIINYDKKLMEANKEIRKLKDELYKYEMQNSKLQRALVEERVNNGKNIITGEYIK